MSNYENAIEIKGLTKKYDGFTLDDISFDVPKGSVMGFIGQNGAGKTTTIKAIFNIISRDAGTIKVLGLDNIENEYEIKEDVAAVSDKLTAGGYKLLSAQVEMLPQNGYIKLTNEDEIKNMQKMLDMFEDNDDVQNVWHNWEDAE